MLYFFFFFFFAPACFHYLSLPYISYTFSLGFPFIPPCKMHHFQRSKALSYPSRCALFNGGMYGTVGCRLEAISGENAQNIPKKREISFYILAGIKSNLMFRDAIRPISTRSIEWCPLQHGRAPFECAAMQLPCFFCLSFGSAL